jgi:hypothetical protein
MPLSRFVADLAPAETSERRACHAAATAPPRQRQVPALDPPASGASALGTSRQMPGGPTRRIMPSSDAYLLKAFMLRKK